MSDPTGAADITELVWGLFPQQVPSDQDRAVIAAGENSDDEQQGFLAFTRFLMACLEASRALAQGSGIPGVILVDAGKPPPHPVWYAPGALVHTTLPPMSKATHRDIDEALEMYDPDLSAIIVQWTPEQAQVAIVLPGLSVHSQGWRDRPATAKGTKGGKTKGRTATGKTGRTSATPRPADLDEAELYKPISALPFLQGIITDMLEDAVTMHRLLSDALPRPYILDDAAVGGVIRAFTPRQEEVAVYAEQVRRWAALRLTATQRKTLQHLTVQITRLQTLITQILEMATTLQSQTINALLGKSDAEVGLEWLMQHLQEDVAEDDEDRDET